MTLQQVVDYCLLKKGAYIDFPFGTDVTVIKVGKMGQRAGRIFAQVFILKDKDTITLNCDMMTGQFYRQLFSNAVVRGYHCPPVQQPYFNSITLDGTVSDEMIIEMIEHSYKTVVGKLPKYIQRELILIKN